MALIPYGNTVELTSTFVSSSGAASDPDAVRLILRQVGGVETTYTYGDDVEVTRVSTGNYQFLLDPPAAGTSWHYRWEGDGSDDIDSADQGVFTIGLNLTQALASVGGRASLLQIAHDVADSPEVNCARPSTLFSDDPDGDVTDRKLLRAITRTVKFLAATYDWQVLRREKSFLSLAQEEQTGAIPADFLRFVPATFWDRSRRWQWDGPLTPAEWQARKAYYTVSVVPAFTQRGDSVLLFPVPTADLSEGYEYITSAIGWGNDTGASPSFTGTITAGSPVIAVASTSGLSVGMAVSGGGLPPYSLITAIVTNTSVTVGNVPLTAAVAASLTAKTPLTRFNADTNTTFWDDELVTLGAILHFRQGERYDYAEDKMAFERMMADRIKQDGGKKILDMSGSGYSSAEGRLAAVKNNAIVITSE